MMQPIELIKIYEDSCKKINDLEKIFTDSGMENRSKELDFGFFPLGSGIFQEPSEFDKAKLKKCRVMVLGNDFGGSEYLDSHCKNKRESENNATLKNLKKIQLDNSETFYTNLFMGVRAEGGNVEVIKHTWCFEEFCFSFFERQLSYVKPEVVLCLGTNVGRPLAKKYKELEDFKKPMKELFSAGNNYVAFRNNIKYVIIPHPSYANANWKAEYKVIDKAKRELL